MKCHVVPRLGDKRESGRPFDDNGHIEIATPRASPDRLLLEKDGLPQQLLSQESLSLGVSPSCPTDKYYSATPTSGSETLPVEGICSQEYDVSYPFIPIDIVEEDEQRKLLRNSKKEREFLLNNDLEKLKKNYLDWVKYDIYLGFFAYAYDKNNTMLDERLMFTLAPKRGNKIYVKRLKEKINQIESNFKPVYFFDKSDRSKRHKTSALYIVLTPNPHKTTRYVAWKNISKWVNTFKSNFKSFLSKKYNVNRKNIHISSYRSWENFNKKSIAYGYPHVNLTILIDGINFEVFFYKGKWRVVNKREIEKLWTHGFIDIQGLDCLADTFTQNLNDTQSTLRHNIKYMLKDLTNNDERNEKFVLLNSILWVMNKRSFSFSGKFREMYSVLIKQEKIDDLIKGCVTKTNMVINGQKVARLEVVFKGFFIKKEKPPPDNLKPMLKDRKLVYFFRRKYNQKSPEQTDVFSWIRDCLNWIGNGKNEDEFINEFSEEKLNYLKKYGYVFSPRPNLLKVM